MRSFELRARFPTGTILVGGHSAVAAGLSASHAVDRDGSPIIPATALRGALRELLEALLRGVGQGACDSGSGIDPAQPHPPVPPGSCSVDAGAPCIPCRLFGTRRPAIDATERCFSSLILGDAVLEDGYAVDWAERSHVAISRSRRSAEDERLFTRRTPSLTDRVLVARGHTVEPELDAYLEAAVRGTKHLGSGRSIGLGRVELELVWRDDVLAETVARPLSAPSTVDIRVRLESPTAIGTAEASDNYRGTRLEIPGSMLRGALGFAIARAMPKPADARSEQPFRDPEFQALVDEHAGAQFGFLYPVDPSTTASTADLAAPWPITARACKSHPGTHEVVDTLLDRIAIEMISSADQAERVDQSTLRRCGSPREGASTKRCEAPLRGAKGTRRNRHPLARRVVTRVSLERQSSSAREGALFSTEMLEPGAEFEGTIRNVPPQSRELLSSALGLPVYVGRGSSSGWGRVSIEVVEPVSRPDLETRGEAFEAALRQRLQRAGLTTDGVERLLPITFLAPFLPSNGGTDDGRATLASHLGEVEWIVVARRFERDGGWDQRKGQPFAELAVMAGAVYVARLAGDWRDMLESLKTLEREGAGDRRHQGYGHLVLFDPFISQRGHGHDTNRD